MKRSKNVKKKSYVFTFFHKKSNFFLIKIINALGTITISIGRSRDYKSKFIAHYFICVVIILRWFMVDLLTRDAISFDFVEIRDFRPINNRNILLFYAINFSEKSYCRTRTHTIKYIFYIIYGFYILSRFREE